MTEFIISSEQLERLIEGIEHNTGRRINKVVCDGTELPEIVRCRDCVRFVPQGMYLYNSGVVNKGTCSVVRGFVVQISPDGFCAWGERKDA